jgi:hypothetical protein
MTRLTMHECLLTDSTLLLPAEQEPAVSCSAVGSYSARISRSVSTKGRARERREISPRAEGCRRTSYPLEFRC